MRFLSSCLIRMAWDSFINLVPGAFRARFPSGMLGDETFLVSGLGILRWLISFPSCATSWSPFELGYREDCGFSR